jgi:dihydrofolate synthase/folylpolyglutamate synthase
MRTTSTPERLNDAARAPDSVEDRDVAYRQTLERLQARGRFGMRLGLTRTRTLLRALGNPHRQLRGVLIGGTNGKGSTQALVGAALREAGYRVGQTPKPHLVSYRERIQVNGAAIPVRDFVPLLNEVFDTDERLEARHGPSTEFEILTSAAFLYFARMPIDVAVIEVGIGGRLDATNVWQGGVTAITNVALDHMEVLGPTVEAIATEKAQIIKRGDFASVTGATGSALSVIRRRAGRVKVALDVVSPLELVGIDRSGTRVRAPTGSELTVSLLGPHQAANAAVAWAILDALGGAGIASASDEQRAAAFGAAKWPGRMELISRAGQPNVLLDGAHNPHGVAALADSLRALLPQISGGPVTVLTAVMANHYQPGMLEPLIAALPAATVIATSVPESGNSLPPARLASDWGPGARPIADPDTALDAAVRNARSAGGLLVVCGSLYLVGHVRAKLLGSREPAQ